MNNLRNHIIEFTVPTAAAFSDSHATTVDLSADPGNLSPATDLIVARVQEALDANQNVILMIGEEHVTAAHVRLPALVGDALRRAGAVDPVIAVEIDHNLLEVLLPRVLPCEEQKGGCARTLRVLPALKAHDQARYNHLQALIYAALDWQDAPAANLVNVSGWIGGKADVRLIDMAVTDSGFLDIADTETGAFVQAHAAANVNDKEKIAVASSGGMRLRNEWIASRIRGILAEEGVRAVIMETGRDHLGGNKRRKIPYSQSLHATLKKQGKTSKIITVFPESFGYTFENSLSAEAQNALGNRDTIVLRGGDKTRHIQLLIGSFEDEIAALSRWSPAPGFKDKAGYDALRERFRKALVAELESVTALYEEQQAPPSGNPVLRYG